MASNLRRPPLFLRPLVVRALVDDVATIRKGIAELQVLPIKLADHCPPPLYKIDFDRGGEITRLDSSHGAPVNDDSHPHDAGDATAAVGESGRVAPPESAPVLQAGSEPEPAPEGWPDAPLPEHADPDLDRPEPEPAFSSARVVARPINGFDLMRSRSSAAPRNEPSRQRKSRATGVRAAQIAAKAARDEKLLAAYAEGTDVADLAQRFGLAVCTVREIAQAAGLRRTTGHKPRPAIAARNAEVVKAYAAGDSINAIAQRFGLSRTNAYKICNDAGIDRASTQQVAASERKAEALSLVASGKSVASIAAQIGITPSSVYQIIKKAGVAIPKQPRAPKAPKPKAAKPPKSPRSVPVQVSCHQGESPPLAIIEAAAEKLREVAADSGPGFYSESASARRVLQAGKARAAADRAAAADRRTQRQIERAESEAAALEEFEANLAKVRERRAAGVEVIVPRRAKVISSGAKLAEAIRRRDAGKSTSVQASATPLEPAPSREECPRCGIPGWKGCAHFLPCEDARTIAVKQDMRGRLVEAGGAAA